MPVSRSTTFDYISSDRKPSSVTKLLKAVQAIVGKSDVSLDDFDEDSITEFVIKPVLKSTAGVEFGAEFEVKFDLSDDISVPKAIQILFTKISVQSVGSFLNHASKQDPNTPLANLIYINKPVCVYGSLSDKSLADGFHLVDGIYGADIIMRNSNEKLLSQSTFLRDRRLYIVGVVDSVDPLRICCGVILLSNRTLLSIERVS